MCVCVRVQVCVCAGVCVLVCVRVCMHVCERERESICLLELLHQLFKFKVYVAVYPEDASDVACVRMLYWVLMLSVLGHVKYRQKGKKDTWLTHHLL